MLIYLLCFTVSILLIAYAQNKRRLVFWSLSALALLIPCLLAAMRAQSVGTDVTVYVKPLTTVALAAKDLEEYFDGYWYSVWHNIYVQDYELGFSLLVYVVAKLTHSLGAVLFCIEALMIVPVYIALARNRKELPLWLGMLVFFLLYYNPTLNLMRQWIAMAFLLLSFQMLRERKLWLTVLFVAVAFLFHTTALIALPLFLLFWFFRLVRRSRFCQSNLTVRASSVVTGVLLLICILAVLNLSPITKLLSTLGLGYYNNYLTSDSIYLMPAQIIMRLPLLIVLLCSWKDLCHADGSAPFYMAMVLLDLVISQLSSVEPNAMRIGSYMAMYSIMWVPSAYRTWRPGFKRTVLTVLVIGYCLFYWYYNYVLSGRNQTVPYAFAPIFQ